MDYVRELLSEAAVARAGLFDPGAVTRLVRQLEEGRPPGETDEMALAGILSTQLLHQRFIADFAAAEPVSGRDDLRVCYGPAMLAGHGAPA
jgi:asparagine synthase (glutamine-hydrolysing)